MASLAAIYKISADISGLQRSVDQGVGAMERMAGSVKGVENKLDTLNGTVSKVGTATAAMGLSFAKLVVSFVSAEAIIAGVKAGFAALVGFLRDSVTAASQAERAHAQLGAALRAQGTAIPSVISAYQGYADALQRTTIFQDDAIEGAAAMLVMVGNVMPRDMKKALDATTELASGLGGDLEKAAMMVAKAAEGNTLALKKLGVETTDVKGKALAFGEVLDNITEKFGGQAAAIAGTYEGRIKQLGNTWNDVQESIGRVIIQNQTLLDAFGFLNERIAQNTGELSTNRLATNFVSDAVILLVKAFSLAGTVGGVFADQLTSMVINLIALERHVLSAATSALLLVRTFAFNQPLVQAFADFTLRKVSEQTQKLEASLISAASATANAGALFKGLASDADTLADDLAKTRGQTVALTEGTNGGADAWDRYTLPLPKVASGTDKIAEAFERTKAQMAGMVMWGSSVTKALTDMSTVGVHAAGIIADSFEMAKQKMDGFLVAAAKPVTFDLGALFDMGKIAPPDMGDFKQTLSTTFAGAFQQLPSLLIKSFTGGGGVKGALNAFGATIGSGLFATDGALSKVTKAATGKLTSLFGKTIGGALGAAIPGLGALIGPGLQALWGGIKKIFGGPSAAELAGRDVKAQLQDSFGGFENMLGAIAAAYLETGRTADMARKDVERLMAAEKQGAEAVKAVWADINRAFDEQKQDAADLDAAIRKYGFSIEELGPKLQKQQLDEQAKVLINDWRLLIGAGIDMTTVNAKMASSMNAYLHMAIRTATEVPAAMKPMLQTMVDQGTLIDENGNKITDLTASGITFAETMTQGFDRVVNALNRVLVGLGLIPEAVDAIPTDRTIHVRVNYDRGEIPDEIISGEPNERLERMHRGTARILPFIKAHSGLAADEVPIIAQTGEAILNRGAVASIGNDAVRALNNGTAGGGNDAALIQEMRALRVATEAFLQDLLLNERTTVIVDGKKMSVRREIIPQLIEALKTNDLHALTELKATLGIAA